MKRLLQILGPVIILLVCIAIAVFLIKSAPEAKRRVHKPVLPLVEVFTIEPVDYQIRVQSQGTVMPHTQSTLVSEVAGRVIEATANFRNGGFFAIDEVLVSIDPVEYQLALANIEAAFAGVTARLAELATTAENLKKSESIEQQHLNLAERQFRRHSKLHKQGTVAQSALEQSEREYLLRRASLQSLQNSLQLIPAQRRVLQAELKLKQAQRDMAQLNLTRTQVVAPYTGRVLEKRVDIGQSLSKGTVLATLYAMDSIEIRLPITDRKAQFLSLPEGQGSGVLSVVLFSKIGEQRYQWKGRIVRTEGAIDSRTRQQFLIAQVDNPYSNASDDRAVLKIGQFVEAEIPGQILTDVFVLPRKALRAGDEVLVITADDRIERRQLKLIWGDKESVVVRAGLVAGDRISLTALPYAPDGAQVKVGGSAEPVGVP
jgi:RND family efflux transporter MFP subunit